MGLCLVDAKYNYCTRCRLLYISTSFTLCSSKGHYESDSYLVVF